MPDNTTPAALPTIGKPPSKSKAVRQRVANSDRIRKAFDREALRRVCQAHESDFVADYGMEYHEVPQHSPNDWYAYKDNGSNILFVAHLDTVSGDHARACRFVSSEAGLVVFSRALDDRLGAYVGLELLPKLGLQFDILLTVGEESGQSTAAFFDTHKEYNWIIEFDRGGTDVVMYQYETDEMVDLVKESGAKVGDGIFSDISVMDDLYIKAFNWGVGYRDYHSARSHAFLEDTFEMVGYFLNFHAANKDTRLDHDPASGYGWGRGGRWGGSGGWSHGGSWWSSGIDDDWDEKTDKKADLIMNDDAEYAAWLESNALTEPHADYSEDPAAVNAFIMNEMQGTDRELFG